MENKITVHINGLTGERIRDYAINTFACPACLAAAGNPCDGERACRQRFSAGIGELGEKAIAAVIRELEASRESFEHDPSKYNDNCPGCLAMGWPEDKDRIMWVHANEAK